MEYNACGWHAIPPAESPAIDGRHGGEVVVNETRDKAAAALEHRELARSLYCRHCGYNLRGLRLGGQCPECGFEVWETVISTVDPAASRLPRLHDPRGVGVALVWLMACLVLATLLMLARPVALRLDETFAPVGSIVLSRFTPPWLMIVAGMATLAGLWSVWKLTPTREDDSLEAARGGLRRLAVGLVMIGVLSILAGPLIPRLDAAPGLSRLWMQVAGHVLMVTALVIVMLGLRGVFRAVGQRSREYRTARAGRQRARDMIAAGIGLGIGELVRLLAVAAELEVMRAFGTVVMWISTLMLVIGLVYLFVNAVWICRSLHRPPPTLRELLEAEMEAEEAGPDEPAAAGGETERPRPD